MLLSSLYQSLPARRLYSPKGNDKQRPLGTQ
ncbi:reverse transcriptase, partial [Salmonella enterica]|nr:reverse transcriptase [Salmonella enterica]